MDSDVKCPKCSSTYAYQDGALWICPECGHEWSQQTEGAQGGGADGTAEIRDANGNVLADGDTVTVIKDLKVKGSSLVVKGGTKVKGIRLTDGGDGHDIACKIPGIGAMNLKSEFVKKS
ncbi:zinc ribbon domain-containing protein YjdM [Acetobacter orleanensis]|uniref:PhnA protein n=1 Tax=Acetobacter orleanensis TaxID=104099 RepID=A0A4Y3TPD9_9PROT|nr:zinc ribbon domain-containing protein YjdM [Acetobacter orleanensis]KXV63581.1 PhnA protein [Acetobacter orleanensis]PCD79907.1 PhnA protein [Acetobacter orleanensis]GAN68210.1 alkylphosphonate uptake protein PhnA [Acetobacter orleanensis JCM 7639]GEB82897.1 PhnA protein [Acetobacter orleanensis]